MARARQSTRPTTCPGARGLMGGIRLSEGILDDYKDIAALQSESWRSAYSDILPASYLDGPILEEGRNHWKGLLSTDGERRGIFLAKDGDALLGFVCVLLDEDPAWGARLDNIHVKPDYRGRGTGRVLFKYAAQWVSTHEPQWPMHLLVFEANYRARRFHEALNGKIAGQYAQMTPAGVVVPSLRFLWEKPATIADLKRPVPGL
jgi:GNAT superfamily N-acetyltransferase